MSNAIIKVNPYTYEREEIVEKHFSKENHRINSKQEQKNIEFGRNIHSILENIDFKNPNYEGLSDFEIEKIKPFIESDILKNTINIYKEFEFIYVQDNQEFHGIIDLLLEKDDEFIIIDYKLKNINDAAYLKQLNGYREYIKSLTDKKINIYLYSILEEKLEKIEGKI